MRFQYNDGGRSKYFKATNVGDCVTRAICNATGKDYLEVYNSLKELASHEKITKRKRGISKVRDGVYKCTYKKYIEDTLGWVWVSCSGVGKGISVHLTESELPSKGTYIIKVSKHLTCIKNGVLIDTYDCSRGGNRAVYGYWRAPTNEELETQNLVKKSIELEHQHIEITKSKVEEIKAKYESIISNIENKIKYYKHELVLETNKMNREIKKLKKQRGEEFINQILC